MSSKNRFINRPHPTLVGARMICSPHTSSRLCWWLLPKNIVRASSPINFFHFPLVFFDLFEKEWVGKAFLDLEKETKCLTKGNGGSEWNRIQIFILFVRFALAWRDGHSWIPDHSRFHFFCTLYRGTYYSIWHSVLVVFEFPFRISLQHITLFFGGGEAKKS